MHIGFVFLVVCFSSGKDYLKTQTPSWHRRYCNRHSVNELAMILLVVMGVLFSHPAFEIRYVALQVRQLTPPSSPCLPQPRIRICCCFRKLLSFVRQNEHRTTFDVLHAFRWVSFPLLRFVAYYRGSYVYTPLPPLQSCLRLTS